MSNGFVIIAEGGLEFPVKDVTLAEEAFVVRTESIAVNDKVRAVLGRDFQYMLLDNKRKVVQFSSEHDAVDFTHIYAGDCISLILRCEVTGKRSEAKHDAAH